MELIHETSQMGSSYRHNMLRKKNQSFQIFFVWAITFNFIGYERKAPRGGHLCLMDTFLVQLKELLVGMFEFTRVISTCAFFKSKLMAFTRKLFGPRQANLVLIAYASSEVSGEPAQLRSLARTSVARSYKQ